MVAHDEILRELKLSPRWVLKSLQAPSRAGVAAVGDAAPGVEAAATIVIADADRLARIAALSLAELHADVATCTACRLCRSRKLAVPGVGDPDADWLFIGEAPGAEEDARGEPFVGQAGKLLDNMLAALGLSRERQVYIANVLKCRPPNNRTPEPQEVAACAPYLARQIELIAPRVIEALGKSAATLLLGDASSIASLRGRVHRYRGVPLVVTYHPAYLLRSLADKAKAWEDLLLARNTVAAR
ncbi:MAG: uracil-DNA glycosylase [Casimicrobiaceae bacterium]